MNTLLMLAAGAAARWEKFGLGKNGPVRTALLSFGGLCIIRVCYSSGDWNDDQESRQFAIEDRD